MMDGRDVAGQKGSGAVVREHQARSILKTISWRIIATLTTAGLVYLFTGQLFLAAEVGLLEAVLKMFFYCLHERVWGRVGWGATRSPTG